MARSRVDYQDVDDGLPQAPLPEEGRRRVDPARRPRRQLRHLRRLRGLELRPRRGRLGRPADRHHADGPDVHLHGVRPRRDVLGAPGRRRGLRLRPPRARSDRRLRHRHGRPDRVRRGARRDRGLHRRVRRGARPVRAHQRLAGLPDRLRGVHRRPPLRRRRGAQADVRHHAIAVVALVAAVIGLVPKFSTSNLFDIAPTGRRARATSCLGIGGVVAALVYGIWFFLAVEGVPLAAEETRTRSGTCRAASSRRC